MKKVLIVVGGIGGLCTAIALRQKGIEAEVFENAPELKPLGAGIVLAANAMQVIQQLGLENEILKHGKILSKMVILNHKGQMLTQIDSLKSNTSFLANTFAIHRAELHQVFLNHLPATSLHLGKRCTGFQENDDAITLTFADGTQAHGSCLIAADGIHSVIRKQLLPASEPRYAGYTCWRTVIQGGPEGLTSAHSTQIWGPKGRVGIVPLKENRVYLFVCKNAPFQDSLLANYQALDLLPHFQNYPFPIPQVLQLAQSTPLIWNDIIDLKPLKQFAFRKVVLIGDAAHASTPSMTQGACQAIEDSLTLANCLTKYANPVEAFKKFEQLRISRTTRIVNQSWRFGQIAQLENRFLCFFRDMAMQCIPDQVNQKQAEFLNQTTWDI